jgi:hypothetical protein
MKLKVRMRDRTGGGYFRLRWKLSCVSDPLLAGFLAMRYEPHRSPQHDARRCALFEGRIVQPVASTSTTSKDTVKGRASVLAVHLASTVVTLVYLSS